MVFRCWVRNLERSHDPFAVWLLDYILGLVAYRENGWIGWFQFSVANLEEDVAWTQSRDVCWPSFVNVLEHPALLAIEVTAHEGGTNCVAPWHIRALGVTESRVTRL